MYIYVDQNNVAHNIAPNPWPTKIGQWIDISNLSSTPEPGTVYSNGVFVDPDIETVRSKKLERFSIFFTEHISPHATQKDLDQYSRVMEKIKKANTVNEIATTGFTFWPKENLS